MDKFALAANCQLIIGTFHNLNVENVSIKRYLISIINNVLLIFRICLVDYRVRIGSLMMAILQEY